MGFVAVACNFLLGYSERHTTRTTLLYFPLILTIPFVLIAGHRQPARRHHPSGAAKSDCVPGAVPAGGGAEAAAWAMVRSAGCPDGPPSVIRIMPSKLVRIMLSMLVRIMDHSEHGHHHDDHHHRPAGAGGRPGVPALSTTMAFAVHWPWRRLVPPPRPPNDVPWR